MENIFNPYQNNVTVGFFGNSFNAVTDGPAIQNELKAETLCTLNQIHTDQVIHITAANKDRLHDGDAMITNVPKTALMIKTADCQAFALYDPTQQVISAIHAGWKSLIVDIIPKTVEKMKTTFGTNPADVVIYAAPSLRSCCSEFGNPEQEIPTKWHQHILPNKHVDLVAMADEQFAELGILKNNISRDERCTVCSLDLFSYRRGNTERMATVIMLQK